jgi:hypothetical protein
MRDACCANTVRMACSGYVTLERRCHGASTVTASANGGGDVVKRPVAPRVFFPTRPELRCAHSRDRWAAVGSD